ncbi:MAG: hypothetical protein QW379_07900 [Thermoplasmata archaeon]
MAVEIESERTPSPGHPIRPLHREGVRAAGERGGGAGSAAPSAGTGAPFREFRVRRGELAILRGAGPELIYEMAVRCFLGLGRPSIIVDGSCAADPYEVAELARGLAGRLGREESGESFPGGAGGGGGWRGGGGDGAGEEGRAKMGGAERAGVVERETGAGGGRALGAGEGGRGGGGGGALEDGGDATHGGAGGAFGGRDGEWCGGDRRAREGEDGERGGEGRGGEGAGGYGILAGRSREVVEEVLRSIYVARAFTAHQLESLIVERLGPMAERIGPAFVGVLGLDALFLDGELDPYEARAMRARCLRSLRWLARDRGLMAAATEGFRAGRFEGW